MTRTNSELWQASHLILSVSAGVIMMLHGTGNWKNGVCGILCGMALLLASCDRWNSSTCNQSQRDCSMLSAGNCGYIQLTSTDEPGDPLTIYGKVLDKKTGQPIPGASLFLFQTDAAGVYNRLGMPTLARIRGTVVSDTGGCFKIQTILPGDYPEYKDNRHMHFTLTAAGYEKIRTVFWFEGFLADRLRNNEAGIVLEIRKESTGSWVGSTNLLLGTE